MFVCAITVHAFIEIRENKRNLNYQIIMTSVLLFNLLMLIHFRR